MKIQNDGLSKGINRKHIYAYAIHGGTRSGKSSIFSEALQKYREDNPDVVIEMPDLEAEVLPSLPPNESSQLEENSTPGVTSSEDSPNRRFQNDSDTYIRDLTRLGKMLKMEKFGGESFIAELSPELRRDIAAVKIRRWLKADGRNLSWDMLCIKRMRIQMSLEAKGLPFRRLRKRIRRKLRSFLPLWME